MDGQWYFEQLIIINPDLYESIIKTIGKSPLLPKEIWASIFTFTEMKDVRNIRLTCKLWKESTEHLTFTNWFGLKRLLRPNLCVWNNFGKDLQKLIEKKFSCKFDNDFRSG